MGAIKELQIQFLKKQSVLWKSNQTRNIDQHKYYVLWDLVFVSLWMYKNKETDTDICLLDTHSYCKVTPCDSFHRFIHLPPSLQGFVAGVLRLRTYTPESKDKKKKHKWYAFKCCLIFSWERALFFTVSGMILRFGSRRKIMMTL